MLEAVELVNQIEETFQISLNQSISTSSPTESHDSSAQTNSQTEFNVILAAIPAEDEKSKRLNIFRLIRELTSVGLKEAKEMTSNLPQTLKESVSQEQAQKIKLQFEEMGATVKIS